ncbi:MAG: hypothetical protein U0797_27435 [Gemmataceae bacterium]
MAARSRDSNAARGSQGAPRNDAYTGLLAISLLAQIVGVVFFYLDWTGYQGKPTVPQMPNLSAPAAGGAPAPGGGPRRGGPGRGCSWRRPTYGRRRCVGGNP